MSSHHSRHETPTSSSATPHQKQPQPTSIDDISKIAIKNDHDENNDDSSTFSSPSLNPSRSSSTTSSLFAAQQLQIKKFASQKTTSEYDSENLPKQLQCGATRYLLIELGEGNGGQVYVPSLALQKRPLPMQHTWRPRYDSEKKAMFFVNLHDRGKLWQLPDVQEQLSSAVEHSASQNNTNTNASSTHHRYPEEVKENRSKLLDEKRKQEVEDAIENSMIYKLINDLTAEETGKRRKLIDRERREFLEEYETFREDFNAMKKLQRVQLAVIEQKLREDIQKVMQNNVSKIAIKAEHKIHAKRRIAELLSLEAAERSDLRFAYDHELMELREDEVRGRLSAKMKTRETASDKFAHFERRSVEGAEEIQRSVLLQEEAVLRGKMFLTFSKLRLGGFLRLMKPEPGDPKWSPWSEEIRPENSFIASKEFGLFYDPPLGEAVHKAWHAKKNQPEFTGATDLLAAARVDAVALFGDFTLGLSELFRLFVRAMLCTAMNEIQQQSNNDGGAGDRSASNNYNNNRRSVSQASSNSSISTISSRVSSIHLDFDAPPSHIFTTVASSKFRWLDAQKAIDGTPMTDLFPSSFQRTKERQLIDVIATEKEWRDRSLANTLAIQQRRKEEAEYGDRMMRNQQQQQQQHPFVDRERDSEIRQVTQHDTAIGRHLRRFPNYSEMNNDKNTRSISREQYHHHPSHHQNSYAAPAYTSPTTKSSKSDRSPTNRSNYNPHPHPTTTSHFKTPQPNFTDPEELLFTSNRTPSKNHSSSASMMLNSLKQREKDSHSSPSDIASERLELIRAIRSGQVLEDDTDAIYNPQKKDLSPSQKVQEKLSSLLSRSEQRHRNNNNTSNYSTSRLDKDMDWSRFSKNNNQNNNNDTSAPSDGGLRWDSKSSKGVTLAEEDSTAFFDINNPTASKYSFNNNMPFRIAPAFAIGTVGVSRGLFIWQVKVHISNYQKYAGASPTFKIGMVSRFFASAMEKASQRNSVLAGMIASRDDGSSLSSSTTRTKSEMINETKAMSYWYDEKGSLWCGADAMELTEVAKGFGPNLNTESSMLAQGGTSCHVTVVLDFDKWLIQFFVNGRSTGVAFRFNRSENGGDPEPLFPCILFSSVGDEVTLMPPDDAVLSALSLDE